MTTWKRGSPQGPIIAVPTITLEGDANGAPHPEPDAYAKKFSGKYEHRLITGGIGHNLPQEAPQALPRPLSMSLQVDRRFPVDHARHQRSPSNDLQKGRSNPWNPRSSPSPQASR